MDASAVLRSAITKAPSTSFFGQRIATPAAVSTHKPSNGALTVRADIWKKLGGRGLVREDILKSERANEILWNQPARKVEDEKASKLPVNDEVLSAGTFDKELDGLTGGFPGGEKGLKKFLISNPLPKKSALSSELAKAQKQLSATTAAVASSVPTPLAPPLLMPGMTVMVTNPKDAYYQYTGIVQRVTDGRVGVLFEGGNWDKLVTFQLSEVERTKKGTPGSNPKSASLPMDPMYQK
eukprot:TRINITY_DN45654_c0_g1_i1.p1 TRINITY_DN45654_c0_g1~~TRINITY_DN45654_c0_g1_i1.p1  ORF type:complete len:238 (-),score=15.45 TRINITY_DN45654_c0_g1_i1:119-832(-)